MMVCPLENIKISSCKVNTCMYWSLRDKSCAHIELFDSSDDIETIAAHKGIQIKEFGKEFKNIQQKAKYIVVLDEYLSWVYSKYKNLVILDSETTDKVQVLITESVLCRLPTAVYVNLVPYLIDQDILNDFLKLKKIKGISVKELLFDIDVDSLHQLFAEEPNKLH